MSRSLELSQCGATVTCAYFFISIRTPDVTTLQPVREAVSYRGLFTAVWFGVREKHCSPLEIYDRLRASEEALLPRFKHQLIYKLESWNKRLGRCTK